MINIERVSTGIVATPHNEDWQIEQLLPNLVFMGGDVRTIFNNPFGDRGTLEFTIEWYLEDVCVRSSFATNDYAIVVFDFDVNFEFDKMVIKAVGHDDVEMCFKVITETGTDIKKIDFFNVEDEETALFWQYVRTSLYRGESLSLDGEQFVTQDGKIIPLEQNPITKYNVVLGGVSGMPVWQAESLNAKFGNADFIKIDGGIFQVETPPALIFLSDNLVNVTIGGYFTTEQYRGAPLLPIIIPPVVKSSYQLWQEGFGYNWDSVVSNAPMTNTQRILHVYTKVGFLKMRDIFLTSAEIYTYNGSVYRQITMDSNKRLAFIEDDYITNTFDNLKYVCVVYGGVGYEAQHFNTYLPVVYSNSKSAVDCYANLINLASIYGTPIVYPFLRGLDINNLSGVKNNHFCIGESLEHLTVQTYDSVISLNRFFGKDTQARILKNIVDNAPSVTLNTAEYLFASISDEKLADWFYNDLCYNKFSGVSYQYGFPVSNVVKKFNINPNMIFKGNSYLSAMPNMVYLEGFIEEDITQTDANAGMCNFRNSGWRMLQNFPMWKVKEGATTGCLLPMKTQTNVNLYLNGSFRFYSTNLEPNKFCEFDENGIIEDPTKYFICNLPIETETHANIQVKFEDLTFKNNYTSAQRSAISAYLTNKKWSLQW